MLPLSPCPFKMPRGHQSARVKKTPGVRSSSSAGAPAAKPLHRAKPWTLQVGPVQLGEGGRTDADDADGMAENDVRGMYMAPCWGSKPDGLGCLPQEDDSSDDSHLYWYPFV